MRILTVASISTLRVTGVVTPFLKKRIGPCHSARFLRLLTQSPRAPISALLQHAKKMWPPFSFFLFFFLLSLPLLKWKKKTELTSSPANWNKINENNVLCSSARPSKEVYFCSTLTPAWESFHVKSGGDGFNFIQSCTWGLRENASQCLSLAVLVWAKAWNIVHKPNVGTVKT